MASSRPTLGFEVTPTHINAALAAHGEVTGAFSLPLPDNLVTDDRVVSFEALSSQLRACTSKGGLSARSAALVLGQHDAYTRRVTMPAMDADKLALNLPYEFKDYLADEVGRYTFDYAVLDTLTGEGGEPEELDLLVAAAPTAVIDDYVSAFKAAHMRLRVATPDIMALANVIAGDKGDYCFLYLGVRESVVHMFPRGRYEVSRPVDIGLEAIVGAVAAHYMVEPAIAAAYVEGDFEGCCSLPECQQLYDMLAVEVARSISFYGFNFPESDLVRVHACGAGTSVAPLMEALRQAIPVDIESAAALVPHAAGVPDVVLEACAVAAGAALQREEGAR